jgi:3-deoxy-manno-octulosonate cytidylyltransferase (CMP-KDO synthetase)
VTASVVIPARYASTRFPAKIVASETGKPLVQHVVDQVRKCRQVRDVLVATDDERIASALRPFGTKCVMTDPGHLSGTDRIAEVATGLADDVVVNVQGDEPEIEPETVDGLIELAGRTQSPVATAATPFPAGADPADPNLVKVVLDRDDRAMYFSRLPIPFHRDAGREPTHGHKPAYYLHLGIYAYARPFLLKLAGWKPTPAEQAEKLEQLRVLEHGEKIFVLKVARATHGIDTPEQYREFVKRFQADRKG